MMVRILLSALGPSVPLHDVTTHVFDGRSSDVRLLISIKRNHSQSNLTALFSHPILKI